MYAYFPFYREHFGPKHPKYSDALMDYGFYLLNVDAVCQAVQVYQVKDTIFSLNSKLVIIISPNKVFGDIMVLASSPRPPL